MEITHQHTQVVWRVQNKEKCGPYCADFGEKNYWDVWTDGKEHNLLTRHPHPAVTGLTQRVQKDARFAFKEYRFGFTSIEKLHQWFSEENLLRLKELGFEIVKLTGYDVFSDEYQCAFIPAKELNSNQSPS